MLALAAMLPACLAAGQVGNVADPAHDPGTCRVLGFGAQPWRALEVVAGALLSAVPVGTLATRAGLGGALVAAAAGATTYSVARRLLATCAETRRLHYVVAVIATCAALLAPPWQLESATVGGSATGALLVLLATALFVRACDRPQRATCGIAALAMGAAIGHEPMVGACSIVGCTAFAAASRQARRSIADAWRAHRHVMATAFLTGFAPLAIALARTRASGTALPAALAGAWAGERGASVVASPAPFLRAEVGTVLGLLTLGGTALALLVARARPLASALVAIAATGLACGWVGAPLGVTRFGAPVLASLAASCGLAGVAMQAIVRAIATARIPFARASATMVLLLELTLPVEAADAAMARSLPRSSGATAIWDDLAWGELPPESVVVLTEPRVYARALAARALGALRSDVTVVLAQADRSTARGILRRDAALVPLWRDLELTGAPGEASLSSLAMVRPVAMAYEPRWGRAIGRHLVPIGLLDRFEPEPRGASDRWRALDAFAEKRRRLAAVIAPDPRAPRDPELTEITAYLLRARAIALLANGDPSEDIARRALDDLRAFAPSDPLAKRP
jgi:hypothetical protein